MIYQELSEREFIREFGHMGRGDQFSDEALQTIFHYLDDIGQPVQMDVIAICCEFSEYENIDTAAEAYGMTTDELQEATLVMFTGYDDGPVVILDF